MLYDEMNEVTELVLAREETQRKERAALDAHDDIRAIMQDPTSVKTMGGEKLGKLGDNIRIAGHPYSGVVLKIIAEHIEELRRESAKQFAK
jgi:hypothetical protein